MTFIFLLVSVKRRCNTETRKMPRSPSSGSGSGSDSERSRAGSEQRSGRSRSRSRSLSPSQDGGSDRKSRPKQRSKKRSRSRSKSKDDTAPKRAVVNYSSDSSEDEAGKDDPDKSETRAKRLKRIDVFNPSSAFESYTQRKKKYNEPSEF